MRHTRARIHLLQRRQRGQTRNPRIRRHLSRHAACKICFTSAATFATRPPHRWNRSCCWLIETTALLFVSPEVGWRSTENISPEYLCDLVKAFCERSRPDCVRWTWILLSSRGRLASSHLLGVTRWFDFAATFPLWGLNADAQSSWKPLEARSSHLRLKQHPLNQLLQQIGGWLVAAFFLPASPLSEHRRRIIDVWQQKMILPSKIPNSELRNPEMEANSLLWNRSQPPLD